MRRKETLNVTISDWIVPDEASQLWYEGVNDWMLYEPTLRHL